MHWIKTWATPVTAATGLVVGTTGLLMFFHLDGRLAKEMHEWFGMLAVAAVVLHLVRNGGALKRLIRTSKALWASTALAAVGAGIFLGVALFDDNDGRAGVGATLALLESANIEQLAPLVHQSPDAIVAELESTGLEDVSPTISIHDLAEANGRSPRAVMGQVVGLAKR